jgi:AraC-like DNA-binding protein
MNSAVERAIDCIWDRYGEPLTLADLANSAILSRFHFSRTFKEATGVSPVRFLYAVRIYQAKRMLLNTSLNVTDISFAVGYNSLGSFTNHFTDSVGVSPSRLRHMSGHGDFMQLHPRPRDCAGTGTVTGMIRLPGGYAGARVYVGVFDSPIVQRSPVSAVTANINSDTGRCAYRLTGVHEGHWFIHAIAVADTVDPEPWTRRALLTSGHSAVQVTAGVASEIPLSLRPKCRTDLPVLLALPDLELEHDDFQPDEAMSLPVTGPESARLVS